jgi:hypothetical protein
MTTTATETSGYYAIFATATRETDFGTSTRTLPTFYLHENVQGIVSEDHARRIALDMLSTVLDLAGDTSIQVHVSATAI